MSSRTLLRRGQAADIDSGGGRLALSLDGSGLDETRLSSGGGDVKLSLHDRVNAVEARPHPHTPNVSRPLILRPF